MRKFAAPRANEDTDLDDVDFSNLLACKPKPYKLIEHTFTAKHIHIYISEEIGPPHEYIDLIHSIATAGVDDTIFIHLNTNGGRLDTGVQILNAMKNTAATTVTILEGEAHSLGTVLFLSGDELVVNDNCMMMFHNFKGGAVGKGNEISSEITATIKWFAHLAKDTYLPFLSEDELERLLKGEDIWMESREIKRRLANVEKLILQAADKPKKTRKSKKTGELLNILEEPEPESETVPKPKTTRKTTKK